MDDCAANLGPGMAQTDNVNSPDTEERLRRLERKHAVSETLLTSARRQLSAFQAELDEARAKTAEFAGALHPTADHARNLEGLCSRLRARVDELDRQCSHLTRTLEERDAETVRAVEAREAAIARLRNAETKLRSLQNSLCWRVTLPLRALHRLLIDPLKRKPPTDAPAGR